MFCLAVWDSTSGTTLPTSPEQQMPMKCVQTRHIGLRSKSLQAINAGEGVEKREPSYTAGGNANQYSHYGEQCGDSLKNCKQDCLMTQQSHCWAYTPRKTRIERDTCTPMLIAALFVIVRTWKQPRCPSSEEQIRKLWYIYTMDCYLLLKKNTFESVLMRWMKLEPITE